MTHRSHSSANRSSTPTGPTGAAKIVVAAPRARAHRSAAIAVTPGRDAVVDDDRRGGVQVERWAMSAVGHGPAFDLRELRRRLASEVGRPGRRAPRSSHDRAPAPPAPPRPRPARGCRVRPASWGSTTSIGTPRTRATSAPTMTPPRAIPSTRHRSSDGAGRAAASAAPSWIPASIRSRNTSR